MEPISEILVKKIAAVIGKIQVTDTRSVIKYNKPLNQKLSIGTLEDIAQEAVRITLDWLEYKR